MKKYKKTYKKKIRILNKTRKRYKKKRRIKLQNGGSIVTHLIDNDFFNWLLFSFQNFFNNFFGFENNVINPSILKGQFE